MIPFFLRLTLRFHVAGYETRNQGTKQPGNLSFLVSLKVPCRGNVGSSKKNPHLLTLIPLVVLILLMKEKNVGEASIWAEKFKVIAYLF